MKKNYSRKKISFAIKNILLGMCILLLLVGCGGNDSNNMPNKNESEEIVLEGESTEGSSENSADEQNTEIVSETQDTTESTEVTNTTEDKVVEESEVENKDNQVTETEQKQEEIIPHTHSYGKNVIAPTCTENGYTIYTCSCGESYKDDSVAASHKWVEATCTTSKKCQTCGITDGSELGHDYRDYVCTRCGSKDEVGILTNPRLSLKLGVQYYKYYQNADSEKSWCGYNSYKFSKNDNSVIWDQEAYSTEKYIPSTDDPYGFIYDIPYTYNGVTYYYVGGAGADEGTYELTDTEIIVYLNSTVRYKFVLGSNGKLTVTYSVGSRFSVGDILTPEWMIEGPK